METFENSTMPALYKSLVAAQREAKGQANDAEVVSNGPKYRYTSTESLLAEGRRVLTAHGLFARQTGWAYREPQEWLDVFSNKDGTPPILIDITFELAHESGAALLETVAWPVVVGNGRPLDKATGAALTAGFGYWIRGLLCLDRPKEEGDDINQRKDDDYTPSRRTADYAPRGRQDEGRNAPRQGEQRRPEQRPAGEQERPRQTEKPADKPVEKATEKPADKTAEKAPAAAPGPRKTLATHMWAESVRDGWYDGRTPRADRQRALVDYVGGLTEATLPKAVEIAKLGWAELEMRLKDAEKQAKEAADAQFRAKLRQGSAEVDAPPPFGGLHDDAPDDEPPFTV